MENTKFRSHQCTFKRNENPNFENLEQICCILSPIHDFYVTSLDPIPHPLPVPSWNLEQLEKKHSNKKKSLVEQFGSIQVAWTTTGWNALQIALQLQGEANVQLLHARPN